jgi:hypothetical protein
MSFGIVASRYRRKGSGQPTLIDGLPVTFNPGTPMYVDGSLGTGGDGLTYEAAKNTIQAAVTAASKNAMIFVKAKNAGVRYIENVVIPAASNADHTKEGISIIGTGNSRAATRDSAVILRGVTGVEQPVFVADASYNNFENLGFLSVPAQKGTAGGVGGSFGLLIRQNSAAGGYTTTGFNIGSSIVNCTFLQDLFAPPTATEMQAAIHFIATDGHTVEGCKFMDCRVGLVSSGDLTGNSAIIVKDNLFHGVAANIAADMYMIDVLGLEIVGNDFLHALPSHVGPAGLGKYAIMGGTVTGGMTRNTFATDTATEATNLTIGGLIMGVNYVAGAFLAA